MKKDAFWFLCVLDSSSDSLLLDPFELLCVRGFQEASAPWLEIGDDKTCGYVYPPIWVGNSNEAIIFSSFSVYS